MIWVCSTGNKVCAWMKYINKLKVLKNKWSFEWGAGSCEHHQGAQNQPSALAEKSLKSHTSIRVSKFWEGVKTKSKLHADIYIFLIPFHLSVLSPLQVVVLGGEAERSLSSEQGLFPCMRGFTQKEYIIEVDQELAKGQAVFNGQYTHTHAHWPGTGTVPAIIPCCWVGVV